MSWYVVGHTSRHEQVHKKLLSSTPQQFNKHAQIQGCLPFGEIDQPEWPLNNGKCFSKDSKPTEQDGTYHLYLSFLLLFSIERKLEVGKWKKCTNSTEFPADSYQSEWKDYHKTKSTISERIFRIITVKFAFQPKFPRLFGLVVNTLEYSSNEDNSQRSNKIKLSKGDMPFCMDLSVHTVSQVFPVKPVHLLRKFKLFTGTCTINLFQCAMLFSCIIF